MRAKGERRETEGETNKRQNIPPDSSIIRESNQEAAKVALVKGGRRK